MDDADGVIVVLAVAVETEEAEEAEEAEVDADCLLDIALSAEVIVGPSITGA